MLALIKNNPTLNRFDLIGQVNEGGWFSLPDGSATSPAVDGWALRGYELHSIVAGDAPPEGLVISGISVAIVDGVPKYVNTFAPLVEHVPEEISRRQFFQVLANRELITKAEALAAVTSGQLPAALEVMISLIADETIEWEGRMLFASANPFNRSHPYVDMFGAMQGMTAADMDQLWRDAAALD